MLRKFGLDKISTVDTSHYGLSLLSVITNFSASGILSETADFSMALPVFPAKMGAARGTGTDFVVCKFLFIKELSSIMYCRPIVFFLQFSYILKIRHCINDIDYLKSKVLYINL